MSCDFYLYCQLLTDTHVVVQFLDEGKSGMVPIKQIIRKDDLKSGDECEVTWSNKKVYSAVIILSGTNIIYVAIDYSKYLEPQYRLLIIKNHEASRRLSPSTVWLLLEGLMLSTYF